MRWRRRRFKRMRKRAREQHALSYWERLARVVPVHGDVVVWDSIQMPSEASE